MLAETIAIQVAAYSDAALADALADPWCPPERVVADAHYAFFAEYLGAGPEALHAQTILTEAPYLSQSYLADYAHYYALSFTTYERFCKRVHFFGAAFTRAELDEALLAPTNQSHPIWDSYLGYVVVKPLPTLVGATLLRPYPADGQRRRYYPTTRDYQVSLLGRHLTVNTLLYQEQDTNVSACATMAIWMAFSKTAHLFQHPMPPPYQITASAGSQSTLARSFPNRGLNAYQIVRAIEAVGLVAEIQEYNDPRELVGEQSPEDLQRQIKGFVYAHLRLGLPVLLFVEFSDGSAHLITAAGYRLAAAEPKVSGLRLVSDSLDRFYAHDDQIGPFARCTFRADGLLASAWPGTNDVGAPDWDNRQPVYLYMVAVPICADIRIKYAEVHERVVAMDQVLAPLVSVLLDDDDDHLRPVWDIYLSYGNTYKAEVLAQPAADPAHRRQIVAHHLPKYVWVARASTPDGTPLMELVFDATDLHTGFFCLLTSVYEPLREPLRPWLTDTPSVELLTNDLALDPRYLPLLRADLAAAA